MLLYWRGSAKKVPDGSPSNVEDQKVVATVENDSRRPLAVASPAPPKMGEWDGEN